MKTLPENHFTEILNDLLENPDSEMGKYYHNFHNYSISNVAWVYMQCRELGVPFGPIASYNRWQELGRQVQKGAKGMFVVRPINIKSKTEKDENGDPKTFTWFKPVKGAFVLAQTEGEEYTFPKSDFDFERFHEAFDVEQVEFDMPNGNVQGFAYQNKFAVSPIATFPHKTKVHEMAHILLGHTRNDKARIIDTDTLDNRTIEVEAESVAFCVLSALEEGFEEELRASRAYVRNWLGENELKEESAKKIFKVANQILKAGLHEVKE